MNVVQTVYMYMHGIGEEKAVKEAIINRLMDIDAFMRHTAYSPQTRFRVKPTASRERALAPQRSLLEHSYFVGESSRVWLHTR